MTPQQVRTARGCAIAMIAAFLVGVFLLYVELTGASSGGYASISELMWAVWAHQPWIVLLVTHLVAAPTWFLLGHFAAQSEGVYEEIRKDGHV
jgi:hypothetical protein